MKTISMKGRPFDNPNPKNPGPGHYEDTRQQHYDALEGAKIGKDHRLSHFLKTIGHTNPGPGYYRGGSFVDKTQAPRFGFGSSSREKDYIGITRRRRVHVTGPGPGSYELPSQFASPK